TNFREIDAMLPMDNCGGGGQNIKTLEEWTKAYYDAFQASKTKLNFYSNNETFVQDNSDPLGANPTWGTATIDRYIEQIRITDKYSKKNFSFAYSHYFSPLNGVGGFHETYLDYMKTGILETEKPIAPTKVKTFYSNGTLSLSWSGIYDNKGISRINIYKDGSFIDFVPIIYDNQNFTNQTPPVKFVDKNFDRTKTTIYEIEAVDCAGNKSATKSKVVVTPEKLSNKVVLDKKYTDIWDVNDPLGNNRPVMVGDVDENGVINSLDALCILKSIVNMQTLSPSQLSAADVDGKNNISTLDSLLILKTIINFETGITK
ncbi:MAG: dockerin type I domain-containing protein, partial [Oscillospiraceae bacterium]